MKIGIMQPYLFPYLGYFSLIKYTDKWIVFDMVQYIRHGWINRNRVLKPGGGWQYIIVPLEKHHRNTLIKDIKISKNINWRKQILGKLTYYKRIAPYYDKIIELVQDVLSLNTESIVTLNIYSLKKVCEYLDISFNYEVFSEMNLDIGSIQEPGDWALEISKVLRAKEYVNPPGAMDIFDKQKFRRAGVGLKFLKVELGEYNQKRGEFEPGLSIIDVMMFNGPEVISKFLDNYSIF